MAKKITTIQNLIDYLKVPDFDSKENQEVVIKKITRGATFTEEFMELSTFQRMYREIENMPQVIYVDVNNIAYIRYRFSDEAIYYKPITNTKNNIILKDADFPEPIIELVIPEEIYNGGYQFYIDEKNKIVASVEVATISNSKNYVAYSPESFSYLKQYPTLSYEYNNVYGVKAVQKILVNSYHKKGLVHRFPIITRTFLSGGYQFRLSYYYKKDSREARTIPPSEDDEQFIAISLFFKDIITVLSFLNKTIFSFFNEYNNYRSSWRNKFLTELTYRTMNVLTNGGSVDKKPSIIFHLPQPMYYIFKSTPPLWDMLIDLSRGYIRNNLSINEEDLILKLLRIIYHRSTNKRKSFKIKNEERFEEVENESVAKNNAFIENLITRKVGDKLLLHKLITGLDGNQFRQYISFIWNIWKNSSYAVEDPKKNTKITNIGKSPLFVDYRSDKVLGFYTDNAKINWEGKESEIDISVKVKKAGKIEAEIINIGDPEKPIYKEIPKESPYKIEQYIYHPFAPIILEDSENPQFLLQDADDTNTSRTKLPAFVLFANQEATFWENVITGGEYALDIFTTVSGIGNIIKAGRLLRVLKKGQTVFYKTAKGVKAAVEFADGVVEVTSGTVNALLKLTGAEDTELGKTVAKYLFYLEMASLAGGISASLGRKLKNTATELVENPNFEKSLDDLARKNELNESEVRALREIEESVDGFFDYSARRARKVRGSLDRPPKEIKDFENQFKLKDKEWGGVFNKRTKYTAHHTSGLEDRIIWPDSILKNIENCIVTHNHPKGTGLSIADLKFFLSNKLVQLRAIGPDGNVFSLRNGKIIDKNNINFIDYEKDLLLLDESIKMIEASYKDAYKFAVDNTSRIDAKVFNAIFDLIKDKVTYVHFIN